MVGPARNDELNETRVPSAPTNCGSRGRAEDAAEAVKQMATTMRRFDNDVVKRFVIARNAANNIQAAFPEGDQRFQNSDDDDDADDEDEQSDAHVVREAESDDDPGEHCHGLLDTIIDAGPLQCLNRAREEHEFDFVAEMDAAGLEFFDRIRVANFIRRQVRNAQKPFEIVRHIRNLLQTKSDSVFGDNSLLEPVIEGDLLLTVLESEEKMEAEQESEERDINAAVESSLRSENIVS